MINIFPSKNGISKKIIHTTIVEGEEKLNLGVKIIPVKSYNMVYTGTTNTMRSRSVPGVSLKPSNNNGGQYFMSLYTGNKVQLYIWEELPIDDGVIQRVEQLAELEKKSVLVDSNPFFEWAPGV